MATLKEKTIYSLIWKFLEQGGSQVVALIIQIILARLLAPEDFGALAIILVFINVGNIIVQSGLNTSLVQSPTVSEKDFSTVFWLCLLISAILFLVLFFTTPAIAIFYNNPSIEQPLRVLALILLLNAYYSIQVAYVQRKLDFKKIFITSTLSTLTSGVLGVISAYLGLGLWALIIQQITYYVIACLILSVLLPWRPKLIFNMKCAKKHFKFGWKLLASGLLDTIYQGTSDLLIGKQFSSSTLGFVSQGKKYPMALGTALNNTIQPVILSAIAKIQSDKKSVKTLTQRALKTSTFFIIPIMTLFAITAEPIVLLLLGEQWLPAVPFLQMYCFVYALLPIHTSNLQTLNAIGRSDLFLKLEIIKKIYGFCILFFTVFVIQDIYAIVGGYILTGIISTFVNAFPSKKAIGYPYLEQLKDIFPSIGLTILSAAITISISFLSIPSTALLVFQPIAMIVSYLFFAKIFHIEELEYLIATIKKLFHL